MKINVAAIPYVKSLNLPYDVQEIIWKINRALDFQDKMKQLQQRLKFLPISNFGDFDDTMSMLQIPIDIFVPVDVPNKYKKRSMVISGAFRKINKHYRICRAIVGESIYENVYLYDDYNYKCIEKYENKTKSVLRFTEWLRITYT